MALEAQHANLTEHAQSTLLVADRARKGPPERLVALLRQRAGSFWRLCV
jgi:hypothetical protein